MRRMRFGLIGTAATLVALAAATPASAATYIVDPADANASCSGSDLVCPDLDEAADASNNNLESGDVIRIRPKAGGYADTPSFADAGVKLMADGATAPLIVGVASSPALQLTGGGIKTIERLEVRAASGVTAAVDVAWAIPNSSSTLNVDSSILSGNGGNPALRAARTVGATDLTVRVRHSTIADVGSAPATASTSPSGGTTAIRLVASLVQGSTSATTSVESGTLSPAPASLFVDPPNENFHLRADASSAIDDGGTGEAGEANQDIDGTLRPSDWDLGADEFVNAVPGAPGISASNTSVQTGQTVSFSASGGPDPNPGGSVVNWEWSFGDGSTGQGANASHAYAAAGTYEVRAWAIDNNGGRSESSAPITVTVTAPPPPTRPGAPPPPVTTSGGSVQALASAGLTVAQLVSTPDSAPPLVSASFPRPRQALKAGRRPVLTGRVEDEVGVRRVDLALSRRVGARCQWFDGRRAFRAGSCTSPRWFRAVVDDFAWRYGFPRAVRPRPGSYELRVRAFDLGGNGSPATAALPFRFVR